MAKTLQFVYYMILCISLFLVAKNINAIHCNDVNDCPPDISNPFVRCESNRCIYSRLEPPFGC
ncbi:putative Late nodulin [Medicago truncatula]|uniref:Nodule Cysteine-Rich (NCR) secreted peptide n=1 Tax=Medicago truncatula TaxID=3880 RepID=A0A072UWX6_MEDTR|nr:Nodule Cysteine-Rich (NCR) secreted peptide [Medicago truncatula]RHN67169.1 putative Late nodulin [Medicago truncatula]